MNSGPQSRVRLDAQKCSMCFRSYNSLAALLYVNTRLVGGPHLRITRRHIRVVAVCCDGVLVHYSSRLRSAVAVLAAELLCGDRVPTKLAFEGGKAPRHCDRVMSHTFKCSCLSSYGSKPKLPSPPAMYRRQGDRFGGWESAFLAEQEHHSRSLAARRLGAHGGVSC